MNGHFSLFFENGMIRYLCSKVNLWKGKYFFFMMEDKMIYQAECLENTPKKGPKKGTGYFFWKKGQKKGKREKGDTRNGASIKWSLAPFLVHTEKVACPLY
jgi:hypothetical protein